MTTLQKRAIAALALALGAIGFATPGQAALRTGFIVLNPFGFSLSDQNAMLDQLQSAGVRILRTKMTTENFRIDFAKRAYQRGIEFDALLFAVTPPNAPARADGGSAFPGMLGGVPLSAASPALSKAYFKQFFDKLDSDGIVLAAVELNNEINWAAYNQDFSLPGEGRVLALGDLNTDPEGRRVAAGYLRYLQILQVLKEARDQSKLNNHTPIILAGLSPVGPEGPKPGPKEDAVSVAATLSFLRAHGLDNLVDAYGIHYYPRQATAADRKQHLLDYAMDGCQAGGKPCWITEWGVEDGSRDCPVDDSARAAIVRETMANFQALAQQGRLAVALYYSWNSPPGGFDPSSVFRCGSLTEGGKAANLAN